MWICRNWRHIDADNRERMLNLLYVSDEKRSAQSPNIQSWIRGWRCLFHSGVLWAIKLYGHNDSNVSCDSCTKRTSQIRSSVQLAPRLFVINRKKGADCLDRINIQLGQSETVGLGESEKHASVCSKQRRRPEILRCHR
jgi:hypothetical protein